MPATTNNAKTPSSPQRQDSEEIARHLVALLHRDAPAEEFAARLGEIERVTQDAAERSQLVELVRMAMAVRNRLELWQQRESGLLTVIESAQDLSARLQLDELL
ncbi:MAG: CdaR family transcriptional regulator, partial [Comamonadaceae bacterium]